VFTNNQIGEPAVPLRGLDTAARTGAYNVPGSDAELSSVTTTLSVDPAFGAGAEELPCRILDSDLWFADSPAQLETAKAHCGYCPVRSDCLAGALDRREPWGVWGGEIFQHGTVVARKRPRGRPRKTPHEVAA